MKYLQSALLGFTAVIIFFSYQSESKAQCPTGYNIDNRYLIVNGCGYHVKICYKCSILGNIFEISVVSFTLIQPDLCTQTWTPQQVLDYINNQIRTTNFFMSVLCLRDMITWAPPCDQDPESYLTIRFHEWICLHGKRTMYGDQLHYVYERCPESDAHCYYERKYCRNNNNELVLDQTYGPELRGGPIDCQTDFSEIVIPAEFDVWSDCFKYKTQCSP